MDDQILMKELKETQLEQRPCRCSCFVPWNWDMYSLECSFELHNHSSGVTCEWFSWPQDQSGTAYLHEHLLLSTKGPAVGPSLPVADLLLPGRLRLQPTQPQQTHCWTTSNTALGSELHYLTWKTRDSSFIWARRFVWWNALTYKGTVHVWILTLRLMRVRTAVPLQ